MDELVQLIFFAAIILFGVLARKRKKRPPLQKPIQPRPTVRTERTVPTQSRSVPRRDVAEAQSALVRSAQQRPEKKRGIAEELLEMLQQRIEVPEQPSPPPEPLTVESTPDPLETLEPAGRASYERFHERYVDKESGDRPYQEREARGQRLELSRKKLHQAFIMKEVLGPPKGIE